MRVAGFRGPERPGLTEASYNLVGARKKINEV